MRLSFKVFKGFSGAFLYLLYGDQSYRSGSGAGYMINYLRIHSWRAPRSFYTEPFSRQILHERLLAACDLLPIPLSRLENRIQARCAVAIPLRPEIDLATITAWFAEAGGIVRDDK